MPVFNAAANQVLAKPVTSYNRGKALRLAEEQQQQAMELQGLQIEGVREQSTPEAKAKREEVADLNFEAARLAYRKNQQEFRAAGFDKVSALLGPDMDALEALGEGATEEHFAAFGERARAIMMDYDPEIGEGFVKNFFGEDGALNAPEFAPVAMLMKAARIEEGESRFAKPSIKDFTPESIEMFNRTGNEADLRQKAPDEAKNGDASATEDKIARQARILARKKGRAEPNQEDFDRAAQIVDGSLRIEIADSGIVKEVNELDGTQKEVPIGDLADGAYPSIPQSETLYNKALLGTGPVNAIKEAVAVPASWMSLDVGQRQVSAVQTIATHSQTLIRALSINPRFPVAEQERIKKEIKIEPGFWDSPELMQTRMRSIDKSLSIRAEQAYTDANNPNLSSDDRDNARKAYSDIKGFLTILGVPKATDSLPSLDELPELPAGVTEIEWRAMTPEDRKLFQ